MSSKPACSVADVVAELQAALDAARMTGGALGDTNGPPMDHSPLAEQALAGLAEMSRVVGIPTDPQITTRKGALAPIRVAFKAPIRKAVRWYVSPVATQTRWFAEATLDTVGALVHENARLGGVLDRELSALRDRIGRLERDRRRPAPAEAREGIATEPGGWSTPTSHDADRLDYLAFEGLMRGSTRDIADRQRPYLNCFAGVDDILDVGCGRGEFLALLRDAGKRASGVDRDADMVDQCQADGLDVIQGDATSNLAARRPGSLGGVFAAQVVEHLPPNALIGFLEAAARALRPGGVIALETINPASLSALRNYFADLTHAQPLVAETLMFLVESSGFRDVEVRFTSDLPDAARLQSPTDDDLPGPAGEAIRRNVELLNALLFAPQDYAVVARR